MLALECGSVMSSVSAQTEKEKKTFLTGANINEKKKKRDDSSDSSDSPPRNKADLNTQKAAMALAIMNGKKDKYLQDSSDDEYEGYGYTSNFPEREAERDANKLEEEMNVMMKELNDLEDMIKGNKDLKTMQNLMGVTQQVVDAHIDAYDKLKGDVTKINNEANKAIQSLNFYENNNDQINQMDKDIKNLNKKLEDVEEEDDEAMAIVGIEAGGKKFSHEDRKKQIHSTLEMMGQSMKDFSRDIESRLDGIYKDGAAKKFGFEEVVTESEKVGNPKLYNPDGSKKNKREREIEKIADEAKSYLD